MKDRKYFEQQEKCECENKICSSWETGSDRSRVKTILTQSLGIDTCDFDFKEKYQYFFFDDNRLLHQLKLIRIATNVINTLHNGPN